MGRKEIDRSRLRDRVLDAAEASLRMHGVNKASMSDLVEASGVSRRTFYKVFASRDDLIKAMAERAIDTAFGRVREIVASQVPTAAKVEAMVRLLQTVVGIASPSLLREVALSHPDVWAFIDARRMKVLQIWREILVQGKKRGEVRQNIDPDLFMHVITAVAQNVVTPKFMAEHGMSMGDTIGQIVDLLLHGVLVHNPARTGSGNEPPREGKS